MTRWSNQDITAVQEVSADIALVALSVMSFMLALRLQDKRRVRVKDDYMGLPKNKEEAQHGHSHRGQLLAAGCNILPVFVSIIFGIERMYTDNPYMNNYTLVHIAAITFGVQLYRLISLIIDQIPDVQREALHVSRTNIFAKMSEILGISALQMVIITPTVLIAAWWASTSSWMPKDILSIANTIMLIVDLSKIRSLKIAALLVVSVASMTVMCGLTHHLNNFIASLDRTGLPLLISAPTSIFPSSIASSSSLSIRTCDIIIPGMIISFFRRYDFTHSVSIKKNCGDEVVYIRPAVLLYTASIIGTIMGLAYGLYVGFDSRTEDSLITYSTIGCISMPVLLSLSQRNFRQLWEFRAEADPFKMC